MANYDATNTNNSNRTSRTFKDLDLDFGLNSVTKDVNKLTDAEAIKRSVRNLINTNHYEKPFHPEIGCGVRELLFELMTPLTAHLLTRKVEDVITQYEPRAQLVGVRATPDLDRNAYELTIEFYVLNAPTELVDLTVLLERLR